MELHVPLCSQRTLPEGLHYWLQFSTPPCIHVLCSVTWQFAPLKGQSTFLHPLTFGLGHMTCFSHQNEAEAIGCQFQA